MPVTFADVLPVTKVSSHEYAIELEDAWCIGAVPNGGYVTSAFQRVARTHMETTHKSRSQPDVINLHLEFLRRTSAGKATFKVQDIKIGSRISNLHITLCQPKDMSNPESSPVQDEVQGYFTMSNISSETGPSNRTNYRLYPQPLSVSLSALDTNSDENYILRRGDPYGKFRRAGQNMQMHLVKPARRTPELDNPALLDQWVRLTPQSLPPSLSSTNTSSNSKDGQNSDSTASTTTAAATVGRLTNDALGFVVDCFPQIHERFVNTRVEDSLLTPPSTTSSSEIFQLAESRRKNPQTATYWYPTLLLNLDIKKKLPDEGVEWLFLRLRAKSMQNGRLDLDMEVWDDPISGELVALSSHAALIIDASRNVKGRSAQSKKLDKSKI